MTYTAVFQNPKGNYSVENHIGSHDRTVAWHAIRDGQEKEGLSLVMLIDGQAHVKTRDDMVDMISE